LVRKEESSALPLTALKKGVVVGYLREEVVRYSTALFIVLLFAVISYLWLDQRAVLLVAGEGGTIWELITALGNGIGVLLISFLLFLWWRREQNPKAREALFVFSSVLLAGIIVDILKPIIGRARPKILFQEGFYGFDPFSFTSSYWSMPSGHSSTAFALGVSLALLYPRYRFIWLGLAVLVALSRVVLTKHYPSDVVVGSFIGGVSALWLYRRLYGR